MFTSIRLRLIVAFLFLSIVTAIPVSLLFHVSLETVFSISFDAETGRSLADAVALSQEVIENHKIRVQERTKALSESREFRELMRWLYRDRSMIPTVDQRPSLPTPGTYGLHGYMLVNSEYGNVLSQIEAPPWDSTVHRLDAKSFVGLHDASYPTVTFLDSFGLIVASLPAGYQGHERLLGLWTVPRDLRNRLDHTLLALKIHTNFLNRKSSLQNSFLVSFLIIYGTVLVVSLGLALWISTVITRPILVLADATEQIAKGDLDYHIRLDHRHDEIGQLVQSFNEMIAQIKQHQERLIYLEKMTAWREIAQRMAHEIKNPLTPIQLNIQQLKDAYGLRDDAFSLQLTTSYEIITEEIENLRNLTRAFSEFARLPSLSPKSCDLTSLIHDTCRLYTNPSPVTALDPALPLMELDREAMRRVFINLIDNALAAIAGRAGGFVRLESQAQTDGVVIRIIDNGHGIRKPDLPRIFEPHFSGKSSGMGLGLAIAKAIVEEHHGSISVDSVENQGTTFTVSLPFDRDSIN